MPPLRWLRWSAARYAARAGGYNRVMPGAMHRILMWGAESTSAGRSAEVANQRQRARTMRVSGDSVHQAAVEAVITGSVKRRDGIQRNPSRAEGSKLATPASLCAGRPCVRFLSCVCLFASQPRAGHQRSSPRVYLSVVRHRESVCGSWRGDASSRCGRQASPSRTLREESVCLARASSPPETGCVPFGIIRLQFIFNENTRTDFTLGCHRREWA